MAGINAILSGIYLPVSSAGQLQPFVPLPGSSGEGPAKEQDVFLQGQGWKNKAVSVESQTGSSCRCGNCPACVVQAYQKQSRELSAGDKDEVGTVGENRGAGDNDSVEDDSAAEVSPASSQVKGSDGEPLSREEIALLLQLKKADAAVRAHEQAHLAAAGGLAVSAASFSYQKGPDGRNYAVGGEVQIDTSKGSSPEETVAKMMQVRAAALAPANPSPQDRKVAASASVAMSDARQEINLAELETRKYPDEGKRTGEIAGGEKETKGISGSAARVAAIYQSVSRGSAFFQLSA